MEIPITELKKLNKGGVHYKGFCNRYYEQNGKWGWCVAKIIIKSSL